jgi:hypothetical protein
MAVAGLPIQQKRQNATAQVVLGRRRLHDDQWSSASKAEGTARAAHRPRAASLPRPDVNREHHGAESRQQEARNGVAEAQANEG